MNPAETYRYEHYDPRLFWRKSTHSGRENCVEVAAAPQAVLVRDSKDPDGPRLVFPPDEWAAFLAAVKAGGSG